METAYYTIVIDRADKMVTVIETTGNTCSASILSAIAERRPHADIKLVFAGSNRYADFDSMVPKKYRKYAKKVPQMACGFMKMDGRDVVE